MAQVLLKALLIEKSVCIFVIKVCIYCYFLLIYSVHMTLNVSPSWEMDPSSVVLLVASSFSPSVKGLFGGVLKIEGLTACHIIYRL